MVVPGETEAGAVGSARSVPAATGLRVSLGPRPPPPGHGSPGSDMYLSLPTFAPSTLA